LIVIICDLAFFSSTLIIVPVVYGLYLKGVCRGKFITCGLQSSQYFLCYLSSLSFF